MTAITEYKPVQHRRNGRRPLVKWFRGHLFIGSFCCGSSGLQFNARGVYSIKTTARGPRGRRGESFPLPTDLHVWQSHSREMRQTASACNMVFAGVLVAQEPKSGDSSSLRRGDARHRSGVCQWEWKLPSAGHLTSIFYLPTPHCLACCLSAGLQTGW